MEKRVTHHNSVPFNSKGQSLLVGNIYCGHCGNRLTLTTSGRRREIKDGTVIREVRARYQCHYNVRHPGECDGQSGYGVTKLDDIVDKIIRLQFAKIRAVSRKALMDNRQAKEIELAKAKLKIATDQYQRKQRDLKDLQDETLNVIRGTSRLNIDLLNTLVGEAKATLTEFEATMSAAQTELEQWAQSGEAAREEYTQLIGWAELYEGCSFEAKKMIVAQFIKAVYVGRNYELDITFNVSFEDFQRL